MKSTPPERVQPSFWDLFDSYVYERRPAEDTHRSYKYVIKVFTKDTQIHHPHNVTRERIIAWRNVLLERASITTWNSYLRQLRAICNFAVKVELIDENPFLEVEFMRPLKRIKKTISRDTFDISREIIQNTETQRFEPKWFWQLVLRVLHRTGMRRKQLVELHWSDISFEKNHIRLRAESSKNRREYIIPLMGLEKDFRHLQRLSVALKGVGYLAEGQVFNVTLFKPHLKGDKMTVDHVSAFFRFLRAKLPKHTPISPHRLRHTFGTEITKSGDLVAAQRMLGHTDIRTTADYVHPDLARLEQIADHWDTNDPPVMNFKPKKKVSRRK